MWDAVSGFIHIFAVLQRKLYKDTSQMELLRELLSLQEEMFILLLSMLEGQLILTANASPPFNNWHLELLGVADMEGIIFLFVD